MLETIFEHHQLPLNIDKSWIIGSRVFSQTGRSTLPCRRLNEGGKILGVPVGDLASCISWMEVHFSEHAPPARTLSLFKQEPLSPFLNTPTIFGCSIFARFCQNASSILRSFPNTTTKLTKRSLTRELLMIEKSCASSAIDEALLNTGVADDREELRLLRCLPLDKGGLNMPLLHGHHVQRHHLISSMRTKEFLKLYYPYLVHDHTILFNTRDIDLWMPPRPTIFWISSNNCEVGRPKELLSRS